MFQNQEIFASVLDHLPFGVCMMDTDLRVTYWSRGAEQISGYLAQEVLGRRYRENLLLDPNGKAGADAGPSELTKCLRDGNARETYALLRHRSGYRIPVHVRALPLRDGSNKVIGVAGSFEESQFAWLRRKRSDNHGGIDPATGLPDASSMHKRLEESITDFAEHHLPFGVLIAGIDGLHKFEQIHGKEAAEAARQVVGHSLSYTLRPTDMVGCWEGQRFIALVKHCEPAMLERVGERVRQIESCSEVEWWGDDLPVTVSIGGTAVTPDDTADSFTERAERAVQHSSEQGGNRVTIIFKNAAATLKG
jgi:diguanylate cyclase (GGDEF)-like protein/PAS domain S-box-containing protein